MKRLCIKSLPPVLCIQLKRFDYDWELNRAIKFDDFFKVCFFLHAGSNLVINSHPYVSQMLSMFIS